MAGDLRVERSDAVRQGMLDFYDRLSVGDVASFSDVVSSDPSTLIIGTAPGEFVRDREQLKEGFEAEGARIDGGNPVAYEEGTLGWLTDEPTFHFPGDVSLKARVTAVLHKEDDRWKLLHMHVSVGVPDEEVMDLQKRWS
jgi:hypothetical protein